MYSPEDLRIEPENDGLENDVPFQLGVFPGSMLILKGVLHVLDTYNINKSSVLMCLYQH